MTKPTFEPDFADYQDFRKAFAEHVSPAKIDFFESFGMPIVMGERSGIGFRDRYTGKHLINCHVNGGCYSLGHANDRVSNAVREALGTLDIGNHHFPSLYRAELARRLSATTDHALSRVVFGVSGGEATDLAIKAVRQKTERTKIVSAFGGYHGHTGLALATGDEKFRARFGPQSPGFVQVPWEDADAMEAAVDDDTAAVILESLPATAGMLVPAEGYFRRVREICDQRGALLILDEVQSGLGRTGTVWSYQQDGMVPDVIVTAKGLSGGVYPISATLMKRDVHEPFNADPFIHISTYGGAELGCIAALAVLDIIEEAGFLEHVRALGERFERELADLPFTLRRRGMFMGLAFEDEGPALGAFYRLYENGVFTFPSGNDRRVVQFLPPLVITDDEVDELLSRMRRAFA